MKDDELWARRITEECGVGYSLGDPEAEHVRADELLCELLKQLGYEKTVTAFEKVFKWYA